MLYLPNNLLSSSGLTVNYYTLNKWEKVHDVIRVGLLNLMPNKPVTELDFVRTLQMLDFQKDIQLIPVKIKGQQYKTTPMEHMQTFYLNFEEIEAYGTIDRLIITGAPVEQIEFEEVRYWKQLQYIMDWADVHAARTLCICWGAQAALYHFWGIGKYKLQEKCFGIFKQSVIHQENPLTQGLTPNFLMPNSRHTAIHRDEISKKAKNDILLLAESNESGVGIVATNDCRFTFVLGHLEYAPETLDKEYKRDLSRKLPIHTPMHYYAKDGSIPYTWSYAAKTFYTNWMK